MPTYGLKDIFSLGATNASKYLATDDTYIWTASADSKKVIKILVSTGAIVSEVTLTYEPYGIWFDGTNIWGTLPASDKIFKLVVATEAVTYYNLAVNDNPIWILFDGTDLWVTAQHNDKLLRVSHTTGAVLNTYAVGQDPYHVVLVNGYLYVGNWTDGTINKVDRTNGNILATITIGGNAFNMAFDGTYLWANSGVTNTCKKIDLSNNTVVGTTTVGDTPVGALYDGTYIWVANEFGNSVMSINPADGVVQQTFPVGSRPVGLLTIGNRAYVSFGIATDIQVLGQRTAQTDFAGSTSDGMILKDDATWAGARDAVSGTVYTNFYVTAEAGFRVTRIFAVYDSSGIPDSYNVVKASLFLYCTAQAGGAVCLLEGTQAEPPIGDDFNNFNTTLLATNKTPIAGNWIKYDLNASGRALINKTGLTKFCLQEYDHDRRNVSPGAGSYQTTFAAMGAGYDHYLVVEIEEGPATSAIMTPNKGFW